MRRARGSRQSARLRAPVTGLVRARSRSTCRPWTATPRGHPSRSRSPPGMRFLQICFSQCVLHLMIQDVGEAAKLVVLPCASAFRQSPWRFRAYRSGSDPQLEMGEENTHLLTGYARRPAGDGRGTQASSAKWRTRPRKRGNSWNV